MFYYQIVSLGNWLARCCGLTGKPIGTIKINGSTLVLKRVIGEGGNSVIYEGFEPRHKESVAVKRLLLSGVGEQHEEEILIHSSLCPHPLIVTFIDASVATIENDDPEMWIVMELCSERSLQEVLNQQIESQQYFSPDEICRIADNLLRAVAHLHSQSPPIAHFDIKPQNFLLSGGVFKLCDFGSASRVYYQPKTAAEMICTEQELGSKMTQLYRPPESLDLWAGLRVDHKADVWALGVIFYTLIFEELPFEGSSLEIINGVPRQIRAGRWCAEEYRPILDIILTKMLVKNPNERATVFSVLHCFSLLSHTAPFVGPCPEFQEAQRSRFEHM